MTSNPQALGIVEGDRFRGIYLHWGIDLDDGDTASLLDMILHVVDTEAGIADWVTELSQSCGFDTMADLEHGNSLESGLGEVLAHRSVDRWALEVDSRRVNGIWTIDRLPASMVAQMDAAQDDAGVYRAYRDHGFTGAASGNWGLSIHAVLN